MPTTMQGGPNGTDVASPPIGRRSSAEPGLARRNGVGPENTLSRLRRRVRILPLLVGLLAMALSVLAVSRLVAERGEVSTIWVAAGELEADQPVAGASIRTVEVSGGVRFEHLSAELVSREQLVEGMIPRVDVPEGTPLSAGQFYETGGFVAVESGQLTIAVVVERSHLPAGLAEGDTVLLVGVPSGSQPVALAEGWPGAAPLQHEGMVVGMVDHDPLSDVTVTVAVPRDIADDAAWLASQDRLAIAHAR